MLVINLNIYANHNKKNIKTISKVKDTNYCTVVKCGSLNLELRFGIGLLLLFIIKSYTKYMTDRHTVIIIIIISCLLLYQKVDM